MSSEIEPRISFFAQMKRKPANTVRRLTGSFGRATGRDLIRIVMESASIETATPMVYTIVGPRNRAYAMPPIAGPAIVAI